MCRGDRASGSTELRQMFKELSKRKTVDVDVDDWGSQEIKKDDVDRFSRISKKATQVSFGVSPISEIMEKNYKYVHKKGSAREGFRHKRS